MFEEVPRERRGLARWLLVHPVGFDRIALRPLSVGPFVLGGGVLLAAVGGSVAVAAAATVLTASAIGSNDVPPRPQHVVAAAGSSHAAPARSQLARPGHAASSSHPPAAAGAPSAAAASGAGASAGPARTAGTATRAGTTSTAATPTRSPAGPSATAGPTSGGPVGPAPSSSAPLGNAVVHFSGYDPATGRFSYQFAAADPSGTSGDSSGYLVSNPDTYTAALAPTASIVSGGSICPPAGSACTPDELIAAAEAGVYAEVAIDATGTLRSVVEVGEQLASAQAAPGPDTSASPATSRSAHPGRRAPGAHGAGGTS